MDLKKINEMKLKIIRKVSVRHNIWKRDDPDYKNRGLRKRSFKEISEEIKQEMKITMKGENFLTI